MATTKKTGTKKKATAKKAAPKDAKSTKTRPKQDLVVFAFRLTEAERTAIHKTAGPRNATQFVRRAATAFAKQDEAAFRAVLKDARAARSA